MLWRISAANYERVVKSHVKPPERIHVFLGALRGVVALTDRRLLVSDFPWFGSASLLFEAPLAGLSRVTVKRAENSCELTTIGGGFPRRVVLPRNYHAALSGLCARITSRIEDAGGELATPEDQLPAVLQTVECRNCGASVTLPSDLREGTASCQFCGNAQTISEKVAKALTIDVRLSALLLQARAEIASILYFRSRAVAIYEIAGGLLGVMLATATSVFLVRAADVPGGVATLIGFVLAVLLPVLFIVLFHTLAERLSRRRAARLANRIDLERRSAKCVACGAPLAIPGGVARLDCGHCRTPLVAAEGLVAAWTGDSLAVIETWRARAAALVQGRSRRVAVGS